MRGKFLRIFYVFSRPCVSYMQAMENFEQIIDEYRQPLFRWAFFRVGAMDDAQDIVQGVLLKLYENRLALADVRNLKGYLYRSVRNACLNHLRKRKTARFVPLDGLAIPADDPVAPAVEEYERLTGLLARLPDEQAEIIRMRTIDALPFAEIAHIQGIPLTTAKSRFAYGIDKLKRLLSHETDRLPRR